MDYLNSQIIFLEKTVIAGFVEYDVVEQFDANRFAGGLEAAGGLDVFAGRDEVRAGMIVGDDDGGGAVGQGVGEEFTGVDLDFVGEADRNDAGGDDFVCAVQSDADQMFLFAVGVVANEGDDVSRERDFKSGGLDAAPGKLHRSQNLHGLGFADTFDFLKIRQPPFFLRAVDLFEYMFGYFQNVRFFGAAAKQDGQ